MAAYRSLIKCTDKYCKRFLLSRLVVSQLSLIPRSHNPSRVGWSVFRADARAAFQAKSARRDALSLCLLSTD
jgi:hypothetical protein